MQAKLTVQTHGIGLIEVTQDIEQIVAQQGSDARLVTLFVQHTSCSLLIQENADPDVRRDLDAFFRRLVPDANDPAMGYLTHRAEGPDDMPAHIKAAVLPVSLTIRWLMDGWRWEHGRASICSSIAKPRTHVAWL